MSDDAVEWIRHRPGRRENLAATGAALGAGLVVGGLVFYLSRLLLAREPLTPEPPPLPDRSPGAREDR